MTDETAPSVQYITDLIENLNEISRIVHTANDIDACLDKLMQLIRNIFIFDNVVLYLVQEDNLLEPRYARAIGRGRSSETDLAWGEAIANDSLKKK